MWNITRESNGLYFYGVCVCEVSHIARLLTIGIKSGLLGSLFWPKITHSLFWFHTTFRGGFSEIANIQIIA